MAILEEPEHLNWFHPVTEVYWRSKFNHVVGVIHTNYLAYSAAEKGGAFKTPVLYTLNRWMVAAHCDKVPMYCLLANSPVHFHGLRSLSRCFICLFIC